MKRLLLSLLLLSGSITFGQTGQTGQTAINNVNLTVISSTITPQNSGGIVGTQLLLSCLATLSDGSQQYLTNQSTWTSSNLAIVTLNQNVATVVGLGSATVTCTDANGDQGSTTITGVSQPSITSPATLPGGTNGTVYSTFQFTASGGVLPLTWSCPATCNLPAWASLSSGGALTGTPNAVATTSFTVRVCDSLSACANQVESITIVAAAGSPVPQLPLNWVNDSECDTNYTYRLQFPGTWISSAAPAWPTTLPYPNTAAGFQQALNDLDAYRTSTSNGTRLDIPAGSVFSQANGFSINQSASSAATQCNVLYSTQDSSLPSRQTVCAHGIQDNLPTATAPGLNNPDCTGTQMYYVLGDAAHFAVSTAIPIGPFSLANGTATNTSAYNDVSHMYTLEGTGTNPAGAITPCNPIPSGTATKCTSTTLAPDHWLIADAELRCNAGNTGTCTPLNLPEGTSFTSITQMPHNFHVWKTWEHGDWVNLTVGRNLITNGASLTCISCSFMDSQISEALRPGQEGHSVQADGQIVKANNNWFEGSASCFFVGGYALTNGPSIFGYIPGQDLEFRRNRCTFPISWIGQVTIPSTNTKWSGSNITRKNCMEQKELNRALFDGYICELVDRSGGQDGVGREFTPRNDSSGFGQNYQSVIQHVTDSNAIWRWACRGPNMAGRSSPFTSNGGGNSFSLQWIWFNNTLAYGITTTNPDCTGANSTTWALSGAGLQWHVNITENAGGTAATAVATCSIDATGNCPAGPINTAGPLGMQVFNIRQGDPVTISGCTSVAAFNSPTQVVGGHTIAAGIGPLATVGSAVWTGTFDPSMVTVTYPWTTTGNASDTSGNCILTNVQGGPSNWMITHLTIVSTNNVGFGGSGIAATFPGSPFFMNFLFKDSIITTNGTANTSGWYDSVIGTPDGTKTENFTADVTSATINRLSWPQRTGANYTGYCNNPNYPDSGKCATGTNPAGWFFPATPWCTGASPTSACIGFKGAAYFSASSLVLSPADWHDFGLHASSSEHNAATDGTDLGAIMSGIDAAQTLNTYVCGSTCGSPGPYADH